MIAPQALFCLLTVAGIWAEETSQQVGDGHVKLDESEEKGFEMQQRPPPSNISSVTQLYTNIDGTHSSVQSQRILNASEKIKASLLETDSGTQNDVQFKNNAQWNKTQTPWLRPTRKSFIKLGLLTQQKPSDETDIGWKAHIEDTTTAATTKPSYKYSSLTETPSLKPLSLHAALFGLGTVMALVVFVGILRHCARHRGLSTYLRGVHSGSLKPRKHRLSRRFLSRDKKNCPNHNWVWSMSTIHEHEDEELTELSSGLTANVSNFHCPRDNQPSYTSQEHVEEMRRTNLLETERAFSGNGMLEAHLRTRISNGYANRSSEVINVDRTIHNSRKTERQTGLKPLHSPLLTSSTLAPSILDSSLYFHGRRGYSTSHNFVEDSQNCTQTRGRLVPEDNPTTHRTICSFPEGLSSNKPSVHRSKKTLFQRRLDQLEESHSGDPERIHCATASAIRISNTDHLPEQTSHFMPSISNISSELACTTQDAACNQVESSRSIDLASRCFMENEACPFFKEIHNSQDQNQPKEHDNMQSLSLHHTQPNTFYKPIHSGYHRRHRERRRIRDHLARTYQLTTHANNETMVHREPSYPENTRPVMALVAPVMTRSRSLSPGHFGSARTDEPHYSNIPFVSTRRCLLLPQFEMERSEQTSATSQQNLTLSTSSSGDLQKGQVMVQQLSNGAQLIYIPAPPLPKYGEESPPPYQQ